MDLRMASLIPNEVAPLRAVHDRNVPDALFRPSRVTTPQHESL